MFFNVSKGRSVRSYFAIHTQSSVSQSVITFLAACILLCAAWASSAPAPRFYWENEEALPQSIEPENMVSDYRIDPSGYVAILANSPGRFDDNMSVYTYSSDGFTTRTIGPIRFNKQYTIPVGIDFVDFRTLPDVGPVLEENDYHNFVFTGSYDIASKQFFRCSDSNAPDGVYLITESNSIFTYYNYQRTTTSSLSRVATFISGYGWAGSRSSEFDKDFEGIVESSHEGVFEDSGGRTQSLPEIGDRQYPDVRVGPSDSAPYFAAYVVGSQIVAIAPSGAGLLKYSFASPVSGVLVGCARIGDDDLFLFASEGLDAVIRNQAGVQHLHLGGEGLEYPRGINLDQPQPGIVAGIAQAANGSYNRLLGLVWRGGTEFETQELTRSSPSEFLIDDVIDGHQFGFIKGTGAGNDETVLWDNTLGWIKGAAENDYNVISIGYDATGTFRGIFRKDGIVVIRTLSRTAAPEEPQIPSGWITE